MKTFLRPLVVLLIGLSAAVGAHAAPVCGKKCQFKQPDGSVVQVKVWGDEFYQTVESLDGYTLVRDQARGGLICYAELNDGQLVSTGVVAGSAPPSVAQKHLRESKERVRQIARAEKARLSPGKLKPQSGASSTKVTTGTITGLCLLIDFPDDKGTITKSEVDNFNNSDSYSTNGNASSVKKYFYDVSNQKLTYTNVVTDYYTAKNKKSYYDNPTEAAGPKAQELILEALNSLEASGFDFSQFNDGSGKITAINALYAGTCGSGWAMGLWPHSVLSGWNAFTADGVTSDCYQITDMGDALVIGTYCHENGHMICKFPDLYDYTSATNGVGWFCLMDTGNYGGTPEGTNPVYPCAYLRRQAGWFDTVTSLNGVTQTGLQVVAQANTNAAYIYSNSSASNEYFIIENRQASGRDKPLPASGVAIWHCDENGDNSTTSMECELVQADGLWELEKRVNYGNSTDLYYAPTYPSCGDSTTPSTNWKDSTLSGLNISGISVIGSTMSFNAAASTAPQLKVDPSALTQTCKVGVNATAQSFELWADSSTISYTISADQSWLSVSPSSGTATQTHTTIAVTYSTSALSTGNYTATITASGGSSIAKVTVSLAVGSGLQVDRTALAPTCAEGANASSQTFGLWATSGSITYSIAVDQSWLSVSPSSGTATTTKSDITVSYATSSLVAGTYTANIVATGDDKSTAKLVVTLIVTKSNGTITASTSSLVNSCEAGKTASAQKFEIWSASGNTIKYAVTPSVTWMECSPVSGTVSGEHGTITVVYKTTALATGSYKAEISITGGDSAVKVQVALTVGTAIGLTPTTLKPQCGVGSNASGQSFQVWNSGGGTLNFTVSSSSEWLTCTPTTDSSTGLDDTQLISVNYSTSSLATGSYTATIKVYDTSKPSTSATVAVSLQVVNSPSIAVSSDYIDLSTSGSFLITNYGAGNLNYHIVDDQDWFEATPAKGVIAGPSGSEEIVISYDTTGLVVGTHTGTITITGATDSGAAAFNSPVQISVYLQIGPKDVRTEDLVAVIAADCDGITTTLKGGVSYCPDLSGVISGASQRTKSKQPLLATDSGQLNGKPAMTFDGKMNLLLPSFSQINKQGPFDEKTIFVVFRTGADVTTRQVIYAQGSKKAGLNIYIEKSYICMSAWNTAKNKESVPIWGPVAISAAVASGTTYYATMVFNQPDDSLSGYLNGAPMAAASGFGQIASSPDQGSIGGIYKTSLFGSTKGKTKGFNGKIAEFWYYDAALETSELDILHAYFNTKYVKTPTAQ